ncbi:hypothetical protein TGPRC2_425520 [Toxoplasma gondii TgCatPRC2]|uniref:Uncharacterized protein n=1 Tax=Toxoplasma gondii TgCatPRC2 TaxID=1130821 RepID=A0A151HAX5_TOXGO|nr:hypothetical protein TGPRC2_425520 [Toxoplasma gondii TgCatPRC2]
MPESPPLASGAKELEKEKKPKRPAAKVAPAGLTVPGEVRRLVQDGDQRTGAGSVCIVSGSARGDAEASLGDRAFGPGLFEDMGREEFLQLQASDRGRRRVDEKKIARLVAVGTREKKFGEIQVVLLRSLIPAVATQVHAVAAAADLEALKGALWREEVRDEVVAVGRRRDNVLEDHRRRSGVEHTLLGRTGAAFVSRSDCQDRAASLLVGSRVLAAGLAGKLRRR